jgi:hypothetical protein
MRSAKPSGSATAATSMARTMWPQPLRRSACWGPLTPVANELPVRTPDSMSIMKEMA